MESKPKHCRVCGIDYNPRTSLQVVCSWECSVKYAKLKTAKKEKSEKKKELLTLSDYLKLTQKIFNQFINLRDKGKPCVSCGCKVEAPNASHFFSVGSSPELRFNELNVHTSCIHCNLHKHGNIAEYSIRLPNRIGQENYDLLISLRNKPRHYTIPELIELIALYKQKIKELKDEFN
jgi:hypothetical protein